jgi:hypothetical protein
MTTAAMLKIQVNASYELWKVLEFNLAYSRAWKIMAKETVLECPGKA